MKKLLLNLSSVALVATPALAIVSCGSTSTNNNTKPEKPQSPVDGVELPDSDKIPPKQRLKLYVPIKQGFLGADSVEFDVHNALKINSHLKGLDLETYYLLIKGRLIENAINKQFKFNVADLDSFFRSGKNAQGVVVGGSLHKDYFNAGINQLADHETIITVFKDK